MGERGRGGGDGGGSPVVFVRSDWDRLLRLLQSNKRFETLKHIVELF